MNDKNTQARRYMIEIANTENQQEEIISKLFDRFEDSIVYCCASDELTQKGLYHTHIFVKFNTRVWFSSIKKVYPTCHIDCCRGTSTDCKNYVFKIGKWESTDKEDTNLKDTHYEFGTLTEDKPLTDLERIRDMVLAGSTNYEIKMAIPSALRMGTYLDQFRSEVLAEKYSKELRNVNVMYLYGPPGTGKTSFILQNYNIQNVYFASQSNPFDNYNGESVLVLDDFRDNYISLADMLRYLDKYPVRLSARYSNKVACYTTVIITSNVRLEDLYLSSDILSRQALFRRISIYYEFDNDTIRSYRQFNSIGVWESDDISENPYSTASRTENMLMEKWDFDTSNLNIKA